MNEYTTDIYTADIRCQHQMLTSDINNLAWRGLAAEANKAVIENHIRKQGREKDINQPTLFTI